MTRLASGRRWEDGLCLFLLLSLTILLFWELFSTPGAMLYAKPSDCLNEHNPWKFFIRESLKKYGEISLWNPYTFSGAPSFANPQYMYFYPFHFLFYLLPTDQAIGYSFALHIFLAGLSAFLLTRALGLSAFGSFISAIAYMFNTRMVLYIYGGFLAFLPTVALLPLVLACLKMVLEKRSPFWVVGLGLVLACFFLSSFYQVMFYFFWVALAYWLFWAVTMRRQEGAPWRVLVGRTGKALMALLLGLGLASFQLLPILELLLFYSTRAHGLPYEYSAHSSLSWHLFLNFISPDAFGSPEEAFFFSGQQWLSWELSAYMGMMSLCLAMIALCFVKKPYKPLFLGVALFSILFAAGKHLPLYGLLFRYVPGFSLFRLPSRMLFLYCFSISMLAGLGAEWMGGQAPLERSRPFKRLLMGLGALWIGVALGLMALYFARSHVFLLLLREIDGLLPVSEAQEALSFSGVKAFYKGHLQALASFLMFLLMSILTLALRAFGGMGSRHFKFLVATVLLIDLFFHGGKYIQAKDPSEVYINSQVVEFLKGAPGLFRVADLSGILGDGLAIRNNLQVVGGYDSTILSHYAELTDIMTGKPMDRPRWDVVVDGLSSSQLLGLLNVKYLVSTFEIEADSLRLVFEENDLEVVRQWSGLKKEPRAYVYENLSALPRAFVVRKAKAFKEKTQRVQHLAELRPREVVILEEEGHDLLNNKGSFQEVKVSYYSPNRIKVEVELDEPGILVLSEVWYPGWKAIDNGSPRRILKADHALRALPLEKGSHRVEFVFDPRSLKLGIAISLLSLGGVVVYLLSWRFFSRVRAVREPPLHSPPP